MPSGTKLTNVPGEALSSTNVGVIPIVADGPKTPFIVLLCTVNAV
jgi:hypothetical protein